MRTVPATADLVPFLLARMGDVRVAALQRSCEGRAVALIANIIAMSTVTWCGLDDDGVVTMGGVHPTQEPGTGYVWQYVAGVENNRRAYVLQGRAMLAKALGHYERLVSIIEPDYPAALRHIRRLGFTVSEPQDFSGKLGCVCERGRHV